MIFQGREQPSRDGQKRRWLIPFLSLFILLTLGVLAQREVNTLKQKSLIHHLEPPVAGQSTSESFQTQQDRPASVSGKVEAGQAFYDLMKSSNVADTEIITMAEVARKVFNLRKIKSGERYEIIFDQKGGPDSFTYEIDEHRFLVIARQAGGWSARIEPIAYEVRERTIEGVIQDSLYLSLMDGCQSTILAVDSADIFAWDIDFALDLRRGDSYSILYEERCFRSSFSSPHCAISTSVHFFQETVFIPY